MGMTIGRGGVPVILGDGTAQAVITAEIRDSNGNGLGDAHATLTEAVDVCESLLADFSIHLPDS